MAKNSGVRASSFWGFTDPVIAWDFDRLCNIRLMTAERVANEKLKTDHKEPEIPSLFQSNELGSFGPQAEN